MPRIVITIRKPKSLIEGWTGFVTLPNGKQVFVTDYCGGSPVAFSSRDALVAACKGAARFHLKRAAHQTANDLVPPAPLSAA